MLAQRLTTLQATIYGRFSLETKTAVSTCAEAVPKQAHTLQQHQPWRTELQALASLLAQLLRGWPSPQVVASTWHSSCGVKF